MIIFRGWYCQWLPLDDPAGAHPDDQKQERAQGRCEYCLIHEADMYYPHEPDHVVAEKHGGPASLGNLAWACFYCNRFKGSDLASIDPTSNKVVFLFNPREQRWNRHFRLN